MKNVKKTKQKSPSKKEMIKYINECIYLLPAEMLQAMARNYNNEGLKKNPKWVKTQYDSYKEVYGYIHDQMYRED